MGNNGNVGNKNSGRKSKKEEFAQAVEVITQEALIKLANDKVYRQMMKTSEDEMVDYVRTKEVALPITLKGMIERKDLTSGGKPIPLLQGIVNKPSDDTNESAGQITKTEEKD